MNIKVVYGRDPGSGRPRGGAYREAKVEFGHKLSDGNLVFGHPHYQTDRTTQPGGSDSSGRPHWLQGKPHRVSLKSIRYSRKRVPVMHANLSCEHERSKLYVRTVVCRACASVCSM